MATRKLSDHSLMDQSDNDKALQSPRYVEDTAMLLLRFLVPGAVPVCGAVWRLLQSFDVAAYWLYCVEHCIDHCWSEVLM